jgi:hypothetical protein
MNGEALELFPRCRFKFTGIAAAGALEVPVVRALDVAEFADLTLVVRVHALSIGSDASVAVIVKTVSPTCEDPSEDFVDSDPLATITLTSGSAVGLEVASLGTDFGSHVQVHVQGSQAPTAPVTIDVTLSAELVARTHARPARLSDDAPENVTKATASAGTSTRVARADHTHDISTGTASEITDSSNGEGSASSLARSDHTHAHGNRGGGSLHPAATTSVAGFLSASDKTKLDDLPMTPTAITSSTSAPSSPRLYLCSPSSSNINVTLPSVSGNAGLRHGVKMVNSTSSARTVTLVRSGSALIDGKTSVVLYVDGDYLEVECDGTNWHVVVDGRIAHRANMRRTTGQSISHDTVTQIDFTTSDVNVGALATTGSGSKFEVRRAGSYLVSCSINLTGIDDQERLALRFRKNGIGQNYVDLWASGNNRECAVNLTALVELAVGDDLTMHVYHNEGGSLSTSTTTEDQPRFSIVEIMPTHVP